MTSRRNPLLSRPRGVQVENEIESLRITRRWFHPMALLVIAGIGPLLFWLFDTESRDGQSLIKGSFYIGLAVLCLYALALTLVNRTVVVVTRDTVTLRHGPLPWILPRRKVSAAMIAELYCRRHEGLHAGDFDYELKASLTDGRSVSLLADIPSQEQARFLSQEITRRLRLGGQEVREAGDDDSEDSPEE